MLIDVETKSGFKCQIDDDIFNDMEMLEAVQKTMSDDPIDKLNGTINIVNMMFGDNKKDLYAHIKKEHGKVLSDVLEGDILSVMNSIGKAKN